MSLRKRIILDVFKHTVLQLLAGETVDVSKMYIYAFVQERDM